MDSPPGWNWCMQDKYQVEMQHSYLSKEYSNLVQVKCTVHEYHTWNMTRDGLTSRIEASMYITVCMKTKLPKLINSLHMNVTLR